MLRVGQQVQRHKLGHLCAPLHCSSKHCGAFPFLRHNCSSSFSTLPFNYSLSIVKSECKMASSEKHGTSKVGEAHYELPDAQALQEAGELLIKDEAGKEIPFKTLYENKSNSQQLIIFIRHFFSSVSYIPLWLPSNHIRSDNRPTGLRRLHPHSQRRAPTSLPQCLHAAHEADDHRLRRHGRHSGVPHAHHAFHFGR